MISRPQAYFSNMVRYIKCEKYSCQQSTTCILGYRFFFVSEKIKPLNFISVHQINTLHDLKSNGNFSRIKTTLMAFIKVSSFSFIFPKEDVHFRKLYMWKNMHTRTLTSSLAVQGWTV